MPAAWVGGALAAFIVAAIATRFHHDVVRIYEARERLLRGALLLDVDAAGEFARHHPRVAINVPLDELEQRTADIGPIDRPIVVFAHSFRRGARAVRALRSMGYRDVFDAAGVRTKEQLNEALATAADFRNNERETVELAATGRPAGA